MLRAHQSVEEYERQYVPQWTAARVVPVVECVCTSRARVADSVAEAAPAGAQFNARAGLCRRRLCGARARVRYFGGRGQTATGVCQA
jgi:hypothetical protein